MLPRCPAVQLHIPNSCGSHLCLILSSLLLTSWQWKRGQVGGDFAFWFFDEGTSLSHKRVQWAAEWSPPPKSKHLQAMKIMACPINIRKLDPLHVLSFCKASQRWRRAALGVTLTDAAFSAMIANILLDDCCGDCGDCAAIAALVRRLLRLLRRFHEFDNIYDRGSAAFQFTTRVWQAEHLWCSSSSTTWSQIW